MSFGSLWLYTARKRLRGQSGESAEAGVVALLFGAWSLTRQRQANGEPSAAMQESGAWMNSVNIKT